MTKLSRDLDGEQLARASAMTELVFLVEFDVDGGSVASAVGHSIVTQASDEPELRAMVRDAVRCHFADDERPKLIRLHFVRDAVLAAE